MLNNDQMRAIESYDESVKHINISTGRQDISIKLCSSTLHRLDVLANATGCDRAAVIRRLIYDEFARLQGSTTNKYR